jgi:competence protein ComEC
MRVLATAPGRDPARVCGSVLLTAAAGGFDPLIGERWRLHATLRRARSFANPRGYDSAAALARRGAWVTGFAGQSGAVLLAPAGPGWRAAIGRERRRIGRLIDEAVTPDHASVLRALVVGDQSRIRPELRRQVGDAGLAHLLSVSGLHIGIVWGLVFACTRWLFSRSEWLLLHTSVRAIAALSGVPAALGYAMLSGEEVPAVRSVAMTALLALALCVGRETQPLRVLCIAAGWIALLRPGSPLDISFQLSFVSVLALVLAENGWASRLPRTRPLVPPTLMESLRSRATLALVVSSAALIGTAPLVALHFDRLSPIGLVTNPILVPLTGTPATVLGLVGAATSWLSDDLARTVFALASWPLDLLFVGTHLASAIPLSTISVPKPTVLEVGLCYASLAVGWMPSSRRRTAIAVLASVVALDAGAWGYERVLRRDLRLRVLDVGQGDSTVLELPRGKVMVIDGGGFGRSRFDVGERVVLPYLRSRKIGHVDYLVATHGDWDHQGGLHALARELAPEELWVPSAAGERDRLRRLESTVAAGGGTVRAIVAGDVPLTWDGVRVTCLNPPREGISSANDASLVLRIEFGETVMLFPGDVEAPAEHSLTRRFSPLPVDLLKAPHHGSSTSSGEALLEWARPRLVVFSVGAGNGYGFPASEVLARYRRLDAALVRTDRDGSVWVESDGARLRMRPRGEATAALCSLLGTLC